MLISHLVYHIIQDQLKMNFMDVTCGRQRSALEMRLEFAFWDFTQNVHILSPLVLLFVKWEH